MNRATTMIKSVKTTTKLYNLLYYLLALLFVLFPFGQLTRLPLPFSPAIRIYAHDVIMALLIMTWLFQFVRNPKSIKLPPLTNSLLVFAVAGVISLLMNITRYPVSELLTGSIYLVRWTAYASLYVLVYNLAREDKKFTYRLLILLAGAGVVSAIFGLVQYFLYPNLRNLMYLGWDPHEYRVFGTFFDSGFTGLIYVLTIILLTWFVIRIAAKRKKSHMHNHYDAIYYLSSIIGWGLAYSALALTYSRASYSAFFAGTILLSWLSKSVKTAIIVTVLLTLTVFILPQSSPPSEGTNLARTASTQARLTNFEQSFKIIKDHPIFGIGFNMLRYENRNRNFVPEYEWEESNAAAGLDNSFLFIGATTGIVGLIAFLNLIFQIIKFAIQQFSQAKPDLAPAILTLSTLVAILIHSQFNNSLFYPWIMIWLWVLFGVAHVPRRL
ncbi:MAG: hypothetical protein UU14_C0009G0026 [Candidatus Roizmanbacteria bacterium GW2011_GWB1_40_7]|uniref:O-antigen ligase-related domain-containing protein n=2 Tax=Candidatus Roizmaniibacteriota TaxID=1752723 RepID=A0A0G0VJW1_9BACT|nr:MAG: hypothetical protein UT85_C0001G0061 [Candidatus Levybacteria bacterium GW2011_GWA2_40_16]KKR72245.1 MAG: hypothetical protein UU14_C0009G0026 [Candidatus Roizmanbacteria bacterium GW2011_GWB1_40_7]KKR95070.1 MAG: hypothetical protein UU41_C0001G0060 [Candidatus Roizmanbacteria bacterium GW2011_GWA1_41_13]